MTFLDLSKWRSIDVWMIAFFSDSKDFWQASDQLKEMFFYVNLSMSRTILKKFRMKRR